MSDTGDVRERALNPLNPSDMVVTCAHLRHKMMYCDERHAQRGIVDDSSDTRVFFCVKTGDALGPDAEAAGPRLCDASRACFRKA